MRGLRRGKATALLRALALAVLCLGAPPASAPASAQVEDPVRTCLAPPYDGARTDAQRRIRSLAVWLRSALAPHRSLERILEERPPEICLSEHLFGIQGYFDLEAHRIVLRRGLSTPLMRAVAIHELRHIHQTRTGICPDPNLSMEATARVTLAMEADASAVSLAVAWQLRAAGDPSVWTALETWPTHADLALAFEAEMRASGALALATARAFGTWYESEWRRQTYYVAACSDYLDRQERSHALPRYGSLDQAYLAELCRLPDGRVYPCAEPKDAGGAAGATE